MKGLRDIRKKLGISLMELEKMTGIDASSLSRYERGAVAPSTDMAQKVANALNITVDELLNSPAKQEFEVRILMGVKSLMGLAGVAVADNSFIYGVQDDEPQIVMAGKVRIDTPEHRAKARELILKKFDAACRMFDLKDKIEAECLLKIPPEEALKLLRNPTAWDTARAIFSEGAESLALLWAHINIVSKECCDSNPRVWSVVMDHVKFVGNSMSRHASKLGYVAVRHRLSPNTVMKYRYEFPERFAEMLLMPTGEGDDFRLLPG